MQEPFNADAELASSRPPLVMFLMSTSLPRKSKAVWCHPSNLHKQIQTALCHVGPAQNLEACRVAVVQRKPVTDVCDSDVMDKCLQSKGLDTYGIGKIRQCLLHAGAADIAAADEARLEAESKVSHACHWRLASASSHHSS